MSDLPQGWEWTSVGEVADVVGGIQKSPKRRPAVNAYPMLRVANVRPGYLDLDDVHQIELFEGEFERLSLESGDCLIVEGNGSIGQVGRAAIWRSEIPRCVHQNHIIRARPRINPSFLAYWMMSRPARDQIERVASSTSGLYVLSGQKLRQLALAVPGLRQQERIVVAIEEHLSRIDAAEVLLQSAQERVDLLARAGTLRLFDSRSWRWTTLGGIAEIKGGVTKDSKRQSDPTFVEVPYLRVANVQRGRLQLDDVTTIRVHPNKAKALHLEPGDVLLNEGGDRDKLGRGWVWEGQIEGCIHQNHVFRARLNDEFDPYFVSTHANTWGQSWFEEHGRQTTNLASVNMRTLKQLPVPAPPRVEQESIVLDLRRSEEARQRLIQSIGQARKRASSLRRSILAAAFSGQLVPQDPDDEPASVLLERIRAERAMASPTRRSRSEAASR